MRSKKNASIANVQIAESMNRGAKTFQTIRWRRRCAANAAVAKVMRVWYIRKPREALSKSLTTAELGPPLSVGERFQSTSRGRIAADSKIGPRVLSRTNRGENGYVRVLKPTKADFHCMDASTAWCPVEKKDCRPCNTTNTIPSKFEGAVMLASILVSFACRSACISQRLSLLSKYARDESSVRLKTTCPIGGESSEMMAKGARMKRR